MAYDIDKQLISLIFKNVTAKFNVESSYEFIELLKCHGQNTDQFLWRNKHVSLMDAIELILQNVYCNHIMDPPKIPKETLRQLLNPSTI